MPHDRTPPGRPLQIGLQAPLNYAYGRNLVEGIQVYATEHANWDLWWDQKNDVDFVKTHPIDGLITVIHDPEVLEAYKKLSLPIVVTTGIVAEGHLPLVTLDNRACGRIAADYFINMGFEHFAYFSGLPSELDGRRQGFVERLRSRGEAVTFHESVEPNIIRYEAAVRRQQAMMRLLKRLPKPLAVFAADDPIAVEVIVACHRCGLSVPEQVAVMGVDNDELACGLCQPPLTSIDHATHEVGFHAAKLLHRILLGENVGLKPVVIGPLGVVERPSTQTLATTDADLKLALRIIHEQACDPISASDVVRQVSVSRTALEKRFHKNLGRSIHQEIIRVRLEAVKRLLRTSELPMPDIAARCGFSSASQVSHIFRREVNLTPSMYRRNRRSAKIGTR